MKPRINKGLFTSRTDDWATPQNLFDSLNEEFHFDLDVAASATNAKCRNYFNKKQNGLMQDWKKASKSGKIFCNPPFGKGIGDWLKKACEESQKGCTVVCVIPFRTDSSYFHEYVIGKASEIRIIKGRLKYNDGENTSPFPTAIIIYKKGKHETQWMSADKEGNTMDGLQNFNHNRFLLRMLAEILKKEKHSKLSVEKLAATMDITDKTEVKELTELAIVLSAREIARGTENNKSKFLKIVQLYHSQVNLSHRTSQSVMLQQYSTPAPIGYLAGLFVGLDKLGKDGLAFEPSAGNGLLTVAGEPKNCIVNEIDKFRNANLRSQNFNTVLSLDATSRFPGFDKKFDAVVTNPPFGTLDHEIKFDGFGIKTLDHLMALRALDAMKDYGRAAIIIGGHTNWDDKGRIQAGKNRIFFNYLYSHYNVEDVILIDGKKLYSRQGTAFNVRLILIDGRKAKPEGAAPLVDSITSQVIYSFEDLYERVNSAMKYSTAMKTNSKSKPVSFSLKMRAKALLENLRKMDMDEELGAPYRPASDACVVLDTVVPDSMAFETNEALQQIKEAVGGDMDEFVKDRLNYTTKIELCKSLSAEQIDAVAMAIYNIEARNQGMIIGDQTGIGKGRVAAAMIRYAVEQGHKPIFITEKANLFSDLYRDLLAIGSGDLVPFIVKGRESKTDIKNEEGEVIFEAPNLNVQTRIFKEREIPSKYDFVMATYSQFNSPEKKPEKPLFLKAISEGNIIIMDESHNSSGSSNTGMFLQHVLRDTKGVIFLSATFAKRPDNMPVYAMKTAISEANMSRDDLVEAIVKGGVALQEVLASQLVNEGQMLRRERSFEGVEVNYISLDEKEQEHKAIADNVTETLREIIAFQGHHINDLVEELDKIAAAEGKEMDLREGTNQAGVDNQPYFSKVFNVINQMLFSIKADAVAERAIMRLKEGKKPVIAFSSTMGSFIEQMTNAEGLPVSDGDVINADFRVVLQRGLDGIMRYTEIDIDGNRTFKRFNVSELSPEGQMDYQKISGRINNVATGISISPIDMIVKKLTDAGYRVAEVTGRKFELQINTKTMQGMIKSRKKVNTNDAFRQFNNNEIDVLLINQSGSTGASAHAIPTSKVPKSEVRQRVMIVLQAELDINTEVQKRGRINRTGQIYKPIYDYVNSAIPAEKRLMMMLQKKLKSLDANTTSDQKSSKTILDVPDFLNKYGDKVVLDYLLENKEINSLLDDPLKIESDSKGDESEDSGDNDSIANAAHKVSGRVAVLSTKMQQDFYNEISQGYNTYVEYLKQIGEYDLEVEAMNLESETLSSEVVIAGKGGKSEFGDDSILEEIRANVLKKPYTRIELDNLISDALANRDAQSIQRETTAEYISYTSQRLEEELKENEARYTELIRNIPLEKKLKKIRDNEGEMSYVVAMRERETELRQAGEGAAKMKITSTENRKQYMEGVFRFFEIGKLINYPIETYNMGQMLVPAVFLGYIIDRKKKNPFTPSAVSLRFALASSNKYITLPASYTKDINAIKGVSYRSRDLQKEQVLELWEEAIKANSVDRQIRFVITGNLLQAFAKYKGKLVSYTTLDKEIKKGILMPEYWVPDERRSRTVDAPISRALEVIRALGQGREIETNNGITLFRHDLGYKIIVPASKKQGGEFYLDEELQAEMFNNIFDKISDRMVAYFPVSNIDAVVEILQRKFNTGVTLSAGQFNLINDNKPDEKHTKLKTLSLNHPKPKAKKDNMAILKIKAKALKLKLELLNFAA